MDAITEASATALAGAIRRRVVSPVEVVEAYARRIEACNPALNAIVAPDLDHAMEAARGAGAALARGAEVGPLHGVPFTAKDGVAVAGRPWSLGARARAGALAEHDAGVVRNLRDAGAIFMGHTNVSEFLAFYDSVSGLHGATANPHEHGRSAGGSSGGEAAAVAACLTPFGVGSDLGGSIRFPAHCTGVFGMRPSRGSVPTADHLPVPWMPALRLFSMVGPLAGHAEDLPLLLAAMGSPQPGLDPDVLAAPSLAAPDRRLRVAAFEEDGLQPVSAACRDAVRNAAGALADAGHEVIWERPPAQAEMREAYDTALTTECAIGLLPLMRESLGEDSAPHVRALVEELSEFEPDAAAYAGALGRLAALECELAAWQERFPLAVCPVAPDVAPPLRGTFGDVDGEPVRPGGKLSLCTYASAAGLPAAAVPAGRAPDGLPVGVQVIGRRGCDGEVIAAATALGQALGGRVSPPA